MGHKNRLAGLLSLLLLAASGCDGQSDDYRKLAAEETRLVREFIARAEETSEIAALPAALERLNEGLAGLIARREKIAAVPAKKSSPPQNDLDQALADLDVILILKAKENLLSEEALTELMHLRADLGL